MKGTRDCFLITLLALLFPAGALIAAEPVNIAGTWETSEGQMVIQQSGTSVTASYTQDNGRITGTVTGNVLEGYWSEDASAQKCSQPREGRDHWGRIRFVFEGDHFQGTFGYCSSEPAAGGWTGKRIRTVEKPRLDISGVWETTEARMKITQQGSEVTASYDQDGGRISGTLDGRILEGFWTETAAAQKCGEARGGTYYWGRIRFVFEGTKFTGTWGYCDGPLDSQWNGQRLTKAAP